MKHFRLLPVIIFSFISSCGLPTNTDKLKSFIPGTYIRHSKHEFGTEYDTLIIMLQNKTPGGYRILRKWKYERILDGKAIEPEYKQVKTTGIYNSKHKLLHETETGNIISFDPFESLLFIGPSKYKKL